MMDAVTKLRQFHSTTPVWAKEDRAVLLASADTIEAQAERIRVLREALEQAKNGLGWWQESCPELVTECDHEAMAQIDAALEATK